MYGLKRSKELTERGKMGKLILLGGVSVSEEKIILEIGSV